MTTSILARPAPPARAALRPRRRVSPSRTPRSYGRGGRARHTGGCRLDGGRWRADGGGEIVSSSRIAAGRRPRLEHARRCHRRRRVRARRAHPRGRRGDRHRCAGRGRGPVYEVEVEFAAQGWRPRGREPRRARLDGRALTIDDPDGIVVDARFVAHAEAAGLLRSAPRWVREPLLEWLASGTDPVRRSRTYRYHVDRTGDGLRVDRRGWDPAGDGRRAALSTGGRGAPSGARRIIFHVDMDAFYASVEIRRRPELAGTPVIVGRSTAAAGWWPRRPTRPASTASTRPCHPARARRLCPHAVFLPGDHAHYADVSRRVMAIFTSLTPLVEPLSLDEAFLDVSGSAAARQRLRTSPRPTAAIAVREAVELRLLGRRGPQQVPRQTRVRGGQAGRGPPGPLPGPGVVVVDPAEVQSFLDPLPVRAHLGRRSGAGARLERIGVSTVAELAVIGVEAPSSQRSARLTDGTSTSWRTVVDERPVDRRRAAEVRQPRGDLRPRRARRRAASTPRWSGWPTASDPACGPEPAWPHHPAQGPVRRLPHDHPIDHAGPGDRQRHGDRPPQPRVGSRRSIRRRACDSSGSACRVWSSSGRANSPSTACWVRPGRVVRRVQPRPGRRVLRPEPPHLRRGTRPRAPSMPSEPASAQRRSARPAPWDPAACARNDAVTSSGGRTRTMPTDGPAARPGGPPFLCPDALLAGRTCAMISVCRFPKTSSGFSPR